MKTKNWDLSKKIPAIPGMVDSETVEGNVKAIVFDTPGGPVRVSFRDYGGLVFHVPAKPKTKTMWKLSGKVDGLEIIPKLYDDRYDANRDKTGDLEVTEEQVVVDEDGNPVKD